MERHFSQPDVQEPKGTINLEDLSLYPDVEDWSTLVQQIVELRMLMEDPQTAEDGEAAQIRVALGNLLKHKRQLLKSLHPI